MDMQELEDKVLRLLQEGAGHLLDDEALVATLGNARTTGGAHSKHEWANLAPCFLAVAAGCG